MINITIIDLDGSDWDFFGQDDSDQILIQCRLHLHLPCERARSLDWA